jgi:membrane associated rhomboid family serine protease
VTLLIVVANILAAYGVVLDPTLPNRFGFVPSEPSFADALTSTLLHANTIHLLGNMVFLAAVGASVELATGSLRFALVYFLGGLAGVGAHWVMSQGVSIPLIGASGAVAGCVGYYSVRYLALKVPIAPKVAVPIVAVIALWVVLQLVGVFVRIGDDAGGTAYWAHLGGFVSGLLLSSVFRAPDLGQLQLDRQVLGRASERSSGAVIYAAERHLSKHGEDAAALRNLAEAYRDQAEATGEIECRIKLVNLLPETEQADELLRLDELNALHQISIVRRNLLADRFRSTQPHLAEMLLRSVLAESKGERRPDVLLSLAGLYQDTEPQRSTVWLTELRDQFPLHPACELARARGWIR